jgi:predicted XRE-type DNA-binding protein
MSGERFESVWDAIESSPQEAGSMKIRSALMMALKEHIVREKFTQARAADLLGVTQPRISDLVRGKINLFSLDMLVDMAAAAGLRVEMRLNAKPARGKAPAAAPKRASGGARKARASAKRARAA